MEPYVIPLNQLGMAHLDVVGGKNASLGEMIANLSRLGVRVPGGFATTAQAYRDFLAQDGLAGRIAAALADLDVDDVGRLASAGSQIRNWILATPLPPRLTREISDAWAGMAAGRGRGGCRAFLGHRRGPARCLLRRPAGDFSKCARH